MLSRNSNNEQSTVLPTAGLNREIPSQNLLINWSRYSSLTKLVRHIAWILKLKTIWLKWKRGFSERVISNFNFQKLLLANQFSEKAKKQSYPSKYYALSNGKPLTQSSKTIHLNPIFKGSIKMEGPIRHADVPENAKHQVIFAKGHLLSLLVIQNIYEENFHIGRKHTLAR